MSSSLSKRRREALEGLKKVPKVKITCRLGGVVRLPATLMVGRLLGQPRRASELLPGDTILLTATSPMYQVPDGKLVWDYDPDWEIVERVDWPTLEEPPEFSRAAGGCRCDICLQLYYDHPADRRFPDAWPRPGPDQKPHYSLTLLCDGSVVKL